MKIFGLEVGRNRPPDSETDRNAFTWHADSFIFLGGTVEGSRDWRKSSIVHACLNRISDAFMEGVPPVVERRRDDDWIAEPEHPLSMLLMRPDQTQDALWQCAIVDYFTNGNSFWYIQRSNVSTIASMTAVPPASVQVSIVTDTMGMPRLEYRIRKYWAYEVVPPEDIVHIRSGIPQEDRPYLGLAPLKPVEDEILADSEAGSYSRTLLKNMGTPGLVVQSDTEHPLSDEEGKALREQLNTMFTGEKRGSPLVTKAPLKVMQFGFNPRQLDMGELRRKPEERICAACGVPPIIAGMGVGIDAATYSNYQQAQRSFYEGTIVPLQMQFARQVGQRLLPEFGEDPESVRIAFNLSNARALQEDQNLKAQRLVSLYAGDVIKRSEARGELGYEVDAEDEEYKAIAAPVMMDADDEEDEDGDDMDTGSDQNRAAGLIRNLSTEKTDELIGRLMADQVRLTRLMAGELERGFEAYADYVIDELSRTPLPSEQGLSPIDDSWVERILRRLQAQQWRDENLMPIYEESTRVTMDSTVDVINSVTEYGVDLPDEIGRDIVRKGGKRVGLVDLNGQTKRSLFKALTEGRELGEAREQLARRIRDNITAGRFKSAAQRALVIARTETKYAQNVSSIASYRNSSVVRGLIIYDAQAGPTDEECESRDGDVIGFEEGETISLSEHPNGTLSFGPFVP